MQLRERLQAAGIDYRPTRPVGRGLPRSGLYALTFRLLRLVKDEIVELVTPKSRLHNLHMEYTRFTGGKWALEPGFWVTYRVADLVGSGLVGSMAKGQSLIRFQLCDELL